MTREELNEGIQKEIENEQKKETKKRIIKKTVKIICLILLFSTCFYAYTTYISTTKIKVREYRIKNKKIPENFKGIKIIQISDLHFGSTILNDEVKKIKKIVNDRKPDIILFTGDLIEPNYNISKKDQENLTTNLKELNTSLGKYAILGDEDNEKNATILSQSNFTVLRNEYDLIYSKSNTPILLIGLSSIEKNQDIEKAYQYFKEPTHNSDIYTITILHEPDVVDNIINTYPTDLFLAGHSHNGNIRIPIIKYSPFKAKNAKKYTQDYYKINNSKLYISSGLGTEKGIRLFCRPSINFFRLSTK